VTRAVFRGGARKEFPEESGRCMRVHVLTQQLHGVGGASVGRRRMDLADMRTRSLARLARSNEEVPSSENLDAS
jgi:hypothetical protein